MTKLELIARILDSVPGVRKDGAAWLLPEHPEVSLYLSLQAEVLTVPRVSKVQPSAELMVIETHKGETFLFATDVVVGAKLATGEGKPGSRNAGFR